ncbi:MAG: metal ABC transporter substrate-binding protein [bacterium]
MITGYIFRLVLIAVGVCLLNCIPDKSQNIKVAAATSMIGTIVKAIAKQKADVAVIVPGGMCPGHFDIKPDDLVMLSGADLILSHGYEEWVPALIQASENRHLIKETINIEASWMLPGIHLQAAEKIAEIFIRIDMKNKRFYMQSLKKYENDINTAVQNIQMSIIDFKGQKAVCSRQQEPLLKWIGFDVICAYGRTEEMSPRHMADIIKTARHNRVKLVVDNKQSGENAGLQIAGEINAQHVVLTNFPLGDSYIDCLYENVQKLRRSLKIINETDTN